MKKVNIVIYVKLNTQVMKKLIILKKKSMILKILKKKIELVKEINFLKT